MDLLVNRQRRLVEFSGIDVDHDAMGIGRKTPPVVAHEADVQPAPENEHEVGILDREVTGPIAE